MDSSNSGSISSSGEEEYNSHPDHQTPQLPVSFLSHPITHLGSISHPQSSLVYSHHRHPSMFDLSSTYLHALSQSQPNSNSSPHNSLLNLDTCNGTSRGLRSTDPSTLPSSAAAATAGTNQRLSGPHQALSRKDASLQLRSVHDNNIINATQLSPARTNNPKKRTRASRRAPTTVLTTDTTNFRSMVQEFTGIPAPPFSSASPYSRRLHLAASSQNVQPINPLYFLSSPSTSSRLLHNSMTNISSSATTNNSSSINCLNDYQLPHDLGLPFHQPHNNIMLSMQNHPILAFHPAPPPPPPLHNLHNTLPAGFGTKSQASLSMPSHEDLNAHLVATTGLVWRHEHAASEGMPLRSASPGGSTVLGGGRRDPFRSLDGNYASAGSCKLNISASASSSLNPDKALENTEGTVDSWICSSD